MSHKKRNRWKMLFPAAIILAGLCVIVFPWYKAWRFDAMQKQAMELWKQSMADGELFPGGTLSDQPWSTATAVLDGIADEDGIWEENTNPSFSADYLLENIEGIITIEKINLKAAILKNAIKRNMDISICSVANTGSMGQNGNYVLAGHNSRIYGRHFNRLLELGIGDRIVVENGVERFEYEVSEIFSVAPSEVWVMEGDGDKKLITLITCDYRTEPMNRLIVRGERIAEGDQETPS